jgi:hypothetical protein
VTIRRGEPWGSAVDRPADLRIVRSDAEIVAAFHDDPDRPVGLAGGDLFRSLGSPAERTAMQRLPIDLLRVRVDGVESVAAAHVVLRRGWWRGPLTAVMNVDLLGEWNVAPRAHPNDGRMDVVAVDAAMSLRNRWQARSRLAAGTHVPHPMIDVRTAIEQTWSWDPPMPTWIDGVRVADASSVHVVVLPDAFAVLI